MAVEWTQLIGQLCVTWSDLLIFTPYTGKRIGRITNYINVSYIHTHENAEKHNPVAVHSSSRNQARSETLNPHPSQTIPNRLHRQQATHPQPRCLRW